MSHKPAGTVSLDRDGRRYRGDWQLAKGVVTVVMAPFGSRAVPLGARSDPEALAGETLAALVEEYLRSRGR